MKKTYLLICFYLVLLAKLVVSQEGFVTVNGIEFYLNGKPFYFAGTNAYYLWYSDIYCSSPALHQGCAVNLLDSAKALNLTIIRTWGSSEGSWGVRYGFNFQPNKGVYDEATFVNFDKVIKEAGKRNIKLIVALVNNWDSFGGMCQYVKWCGLPDADLCEAGEPWPFPHAYVHDSFYTDDCIKGLYKNYIAYFLNRINTITGIKYKDDPTIMAWELANEPRCRSDKTGDTLNNWIGEMSAYIKTIDSNHLVTVGIDGGYVNKNYEGHPNNWWHTGGEGQDFIRNHKWGNIDFATFNYYDDANRFDVNQTLWIQEHIEDSHNIIGKPVILQEFNTIDETNRASKLSVIYGKLENFNINGDTFWMLSDFRGADEDGFEVLCPEDSEICQIISNHALYMYNKSDPGINFLINLQKGWNLISLPLALDDNSVANIFSGIPYSSLFYYNNGWKVPTKIESNKGYWVKVGGNYVMNIRGNPIESPDFNAGTEWKLLGYPYLEEKDISILPYNVASYRYDNSNWYSYNSGRTLNSMSKFKPGYGYWIKKI